MITKKCSNQLSAIFKNNMELIDSSYYSMKFNLDVSQNSKIL